jgi:hypothetical protein
MSETLKRYEDLKQELIRVRARNGPDSDEEERVWGLLEAVWAKLTPADRNSITEVPTCGAVGCDTLKAVSYQALIGISGTPTLVEMDLCSVHYKMISVRGGTRNFRMRSGAYRIVPRESLH